MTRMHHVLLCVLVACGPSHRDTNGDDQQGADAKPVDAYCPTSISGRVFAPNGTLPLYNVTVYAPISDPPPFTQGVQCSQCSTNLPGGAYASVTTDTNGAFKLEGIPIGPNVQIVVTTGKWRRKFTVATTACADTPITDGMFRLPKNKTEGEIPKIAVVTGGCDALACILSKMGLDATEFGSASAAQSVTFFNGNGGAAPGTPQASTALHGNLNEMKKYDVVINSCECDEHNENKTTPDLLRQYADAGGRVLGSHFHYTWSKNLVPAWQGLANWSSASTTTPDLVDMSHPVGMALAQWLANPAVGGSATLGQIVLGVKTYNASTVNAGATRWLYSSGSPATTHYLSWNTPVGVMPENQCGKVVYAGMHVSSGSSVSTNFPTGCSGALTPDEKAFIFLLFDLQNCVGQIF